mmetsp:Transcript_66793/g.136051  ORF Transcript_66793/g.136051 Transcript_66793/m.136051 type:complete len:82 (-) Transcript_66793:133-378(-)
MKTTLNGFPVHTHPFTTIQQLFINTLLDRTTRIYTLKHSTTNPIQQTTETKEETLQTINKGLNFYFNSQVRKFESNFKRIA